MEVARATMTKAGVEARDIVAIGITNQRETTVVWDKETGAPIANAIVWQCRRTADIIDDLRAQGYEEQIRKKTGLVPDAYFSGSKVKWLLDNVPTAREKAAQGRLLFGTIDTWLIWKLTGGRVHVTDYTNASRTMLYNIHTLAWDDALLKMLDIPACMLPEVKPSSYVYGKTDHDLFGGEIPIAGAAIQWLRDELSILSSAAESEQYAQSTVDTAGGYVVPAFTGLGAPYWSQQARGMIVGITRGFSRAHLVRATLESLAYQTYDIVKAMERDSGVTITQLKVDGGACANDFLMQFQSDITGSAVYRPRCIETTALGAAYLAGLAVGYWSSLEHIQSNWAIDRVFEPALSSQRRDELLSGWHRAIECALYWSQQK